MSNRLPVAFALLNICAIATGLFAQTSAASAPATEPSTTPAPFLLGADISALPTFEQRGAVYHDTDGKPDDAIAIFTRHGWNCFRLRLFVNPDGRGGVVNDLAYTRTLAKRIKTAGAVFILDFHYSDTWADPQHQVKPAAWKDLPFDQMEKQVEQYTADVMKDLKTNGLQPDIVQVGNEITGGTLWPDARVQTPPSTIKSWDRDHARVATTLPQPYDEAQQWDHLSRVVKAGVRGVRSIATSPADRVRIMIHIDCGGDWPTTQWFFDHLNQHQVEYDVIGLSYYPNWHGTIENLQSNLNQIVARYGKDVIVVETAYPWKNAQDWTKRSNMNWPITADGQRAFLSDVIRAVRQAPQNHGLGVVWWHPESVQGKSPNARAWNGGGMALFDDDAKALPAIDALNATVH